MNVDPEFKIVGPISTKSLGSMLNRRLMFEESLGSMFYRSLRFEGSLGEMFSRSLVFEGSLEKMFFRSLRCKARGCRCW